MHSDSVETFLGLARVNRLLTSNQLDELTRSQDAPLHSLSALTDFLQTQGQLTQFQANAISTGQSADLVIGEYLLTTDLGPNMQGHLFTARHLQNSGNVTLQRFGQRWLEQFHSRESFLENLRRASRISHPHLAEIMECGIDGDIAFLAIKSFDGISLEQLVRDLGPIPLQLLSKYARQIASALAAVHAAYEVHGQVRPEVLKVGPVEEFTQEASTPSFRPSAGAICKLFELGMAPERSSMEPHMDPSLPSASRQLFFAPEQASGSKLSPACDIFCLGCTLYFLLTGRSPLAADATRAPIAGSLAHLRPDLPANWVNLIDRMMSASPSDRPTIQEVVEQLEARESPSSTINPSPENERSDEHRILDLESYPSGDPGQELHLEAVEHTIPAVDPFDNLSADPWVVTPYDGPSTESRIVLPDVDPAVSDSSSAFVPPSDIAPIRKNSPSAADRFKLKLWALVGLGFWLTAGLLWFVLLNQSGCFQEPAKTQFEKSSRE